MSVLQLLPSEPSTKANPERVAPLATLPLFWKLTGKRVLVAGGSDAAAWKAELLAACGAEVHVCASELSETFTQLLSRKTPTTALAFVHHKREWNACDFEGVTLAIADCEGEFSQAFFDAACLAGVPVNIIDKPAFCQFQFGSIVNRSPLVVAISTDGAAPILAQAVRRRIETLLPPALKQWTELAKTLRDMVSARLQPGISRRMFWERFVDKAFQGKPTPDNVIAELEGYEPPSIGHVTLVGAGPGDAELLTIKAVRALQAADVILFDDLVSDDVLELARREAKRMLVGKRGGRTSCRQEDINATMISLAKAGKNVVRLKSGDPMIFGRAGEEIDCLQSEGIPVDVIPGVTSACAMAAQLGVSLTHRDHSQSVRFVTGHSRHGALPEDVDWKNLAQPKNTTIFYMGGRTAPSIRKQLLAAGMPPHTPAVIVSSVTRDKQKSWSGIVDHLADAMEHIGVNNPVLIGVGEVFKNARKQKRRFDQQQEMLPSPQPISAAGAR